MVLNFAKASKIKIQDRGHAFWSYSVEFYAKTGMGKVGT